MDEIVKALLKRFDTKAAIFDLDGTLIDNNNFHLTTWLQYLNSKGRIVTEEEYRQHFNGRTNKDVLEYIYEKPLTAEEALVYSLEKEALYREIYKEHIQPVAGLLDLLGAFAGNNIPMAIATSGIQPNIDFLFEHIDIKKYFSAVINSSHVKLGKPDPEIYQKAAEALNVAPQNCLAFEDAVVGIRSAKTAGMKVVAITTTEPAQALAQADLIVKDFTAKSFS
ncbi:HAD family phosphatase [Ferruginibacter sp. HRS2-29]|uniref:HAD family hydrolase n=1 Tax=Ferruginibacter sp. HRS2-29 TaxID=2487334 RepID=UPI0020CC48FD|nr:HAD family phosphatase [Ferruginibacter sp. HRS2-29]MCP9752530.1 HAD family phosphatase [Ferruginibacter sp. HRS2-29]